MTEVQGRWDPGFEDVVAQFRTNLAERGEIGAALNVLVGGEPVVDVWAGTTAKHDGRPWQADTLVTVHSCTKGATALCAHLLVDRGELDLDAPLADVWPELPAAQQGATVRMALDHSLGLPAIRTPLNAGDVCDWDTMVAALEGTEPWWEPGTRNGYHVLTFGWTVGELVRRVSGRSLGRFFRDEVTEPLGGLDFSIGLPEAEHGRMARIVPWKPGPDHRSVFTDALLADRAGISALALLNNGGISANDPACWSAEIGGGGGVASARGLAGMYRPLAAGGGDLVSNEAVHRMGAVAGASAVDATLRIGTRFGLGFMVSIDNRRAAEGARDSAVIGSRAFGHPGAGGSIGFADPECDLAFGYVMNQMGAGILLNERGQSLVDATYRCLGYRTNIPGAWVR